jgi:hypothetical protein
VREVDEERREEDVRWWTPFVVPGGLGGAKFKAAENWPQTQPTTPPFVPRKNAGNQTPKIHQLLVVEM